ncbi:MAG: hypothetical protein AUJ74_07385 [Candidatus Omnitrophica bacterium CG1_02_44_16]|nr:MAG: hypothetical protein AUJ74_07385 [Candidatus Omnitrophica bacterium CG1_02_44_16]PIY82315.1 MAG: hypothetical protein COY78_07715 [Candidatus Omnitrophica bacterium CG_4_10_14_0_8_um_filter_44_12]PIZ83540.1 MAG: hypothetical protein COX96_07595 [Candidatus Omnitrophica bacterium CG_4_10_14_0_2_um_filter_44_9]
MKMFVGNLSFDAKEADIKTLFEGFGSVSSVVIVMEKKEAKSRGFGFVEMPDGQQAGAAIAALNDKEFMGRPLNVSQARVKTEEKKPDPITTWHDPSYEKKKEYEGNRPARGTWPGRFPSRERKKEGGAKPWHKREGEVRPWKKTEGEAKPWKKREGEFRPWKTAEGKANPWKRLEAGPSHWKKTEGAPRPCKKTGTTSSGYWKRAEGAPGAWKKTQGVSRPWKKTGAAFGARQKGDGPARPWKTAGGAPQPWKKFGAGSRTKRNPFTR